MKYCIIFVLIGCQNFTESDPHDIFTTVDVVAGVIVIVRTTCGTVIISFIVIVIVIILGLDVPLR